MAALGAPTMLPMPRDQIRRLQRILKAQGLYNGRVNGSWNQGTQSALRRFQQRNNLPVTGTYDAATSGMLSDALRRLTQGSQPVQGLDDETMEFIRETYGYLSMFLRHPEIGPIIVEAANERWDSVRLNAALAETQWYQTTAPSARSWYQLRFTDPAAARRRRTEMESVVRDEMFRLGLQLRPQRLNRIVEQAIINGWQPNEITDALTDEARYNNGNQATGQIMTDMRRIAQIRSAYLMPDNAKGNHRYAVRIAAGEMTLDDLEAEFAERAAARYPWLADQIRNGTSIRDLFDSHIQAVADELELDPDGVDLNDPTWNSIVNFTDENGNQRQMTVGEARLMARKQPGFRRTAAARRDGASLALTIGQAFGNF